MHTRSSPRLSLSFPRVPVAEQPTRFQQAWRDWLADQVALAPEEDGLIHPDLAFVGGWTAHTNYIGQHINELKADAVELRVACVTAQACITALEQELKTAHCKTCEGTGDHFENSEAVFGVHGGWVPTGPCHDCIP